MILVSFGHPVDRQGRGRQVGKGERKEREEGSVVGNFSFTYFGRNVFILIHIRADLMTYLLNIRSYIQISIISWSNNYRHLCMHRLIQAQLKL